MTGAGGAGEGRGKPASTSSRSAEPGNRRADDVEGDWQGPWVEIPEGAGIEVAVEGRVHRGSLRGFEGYEDRVY